MITNYSVRHCEHITDRPFKTVVDAFEAATGTVENPGFKAAIASAPDAAQFEARVLEHIGPSGFTRFLTTDHGGWLGHLGLKAKAKMYTIGNPLIAVTMIRHSVAAGLNVPVRLMIYEDADGRTRLVYDLPSSLLSVLGNAEVDAAARQLDAKLIALAEHATAASA
ncbi:MAG: DUF302 domain-containing protein [Verrucomicrobiota bacterium]